MHPKSARYLDLTASKFNFPNINIRESSPLTPPGISNIPSSNAIESLQSQAQSGASVAATGVSSVVSQAQSAVSSAVNAFETAVNALIPKNCTLGTEYLCVGFSDHVLNFTLPLNVSDPLSGVLSDFPVSPTQNLQHLNQSLQTLERTLSTITSQNFKIYFVVGLVFVICALGLGILFVCPLWTCSTWTLHGFNMPLVLMLKVLFSVFCCITFLIPTVILYVVVSNVHRMPFKVESGDVNVLCFLAFVFAGVAVMKGSFALWITSQL